MLDVAITGGTVVAPLGTGSWDIGVAGEKIVAITVPGGLPEAKRTVEASGRIVVPGGIEAHTHASLPHVAKMLGVAPTAGPLETTLAAVWGGTTTVVDFAKVTEHPSGDLVKGAMDFLSHFDGHAYADYSAHCTYWGQSTDMPKIEQVKDLVEAGFPTLKVFTTNHQPRDHKPLMMLDMGRIVEIMRRAERHGGVVVVHAEDDEIIQWNYQLARHDDGSWPDWTHLPEIRSSLSEDMAVARAIRAAEFTGCPMYVAHVSAKEAVDAIGASRARGASVFAETILLYASFTSEHYHRHDGMIYHTYPSTKAEADRLRLWEGLLKGDVAWMATDAIGSCYEDKVAGTTVVDVQGGNNGIELRLAVTYSEGVVKQKMPLERYVEVIATNPAKLLGLYPRKGVLAPGSDADIVLIDPAAVRTVRAADLHSYDYTPWEGWEVTGWPDTVLLRGKVVVEKGTLHGLPTDGRLIPRKIDRSLVERAR